MIDLDLSDGSGVPYDEGAVDFYHVLFDGILVSTATAIESASVTEHDCGHERKPVLMECKTGIDSRKALERLSIKRPHR